MYANILHFTETVILSKEIQLLLGVFFKLNFAFLNKIVK